MKYIIICLLLNLSISAEAKTENVWSEFIKIPNIANYNKCVGAISSSKLNGQNANRCVTCSELFDDSLKLQHFLTLVEKGNRNALDIAVKLTPLSDGHVKEEICRSIGKTIKRQAEELLTIIINNNSNNEDVKCMVTILGDEFSDNDKKRLSEINDRIKHISRIHDKKLYWPKNMVNKYLSDYSATITRVLKEQTQ